MRVEVKMRAFVFVMLLGSGCATTATTVKEREADGITQIAFGAPLIISGGVAAVSTVISFGGAAFSSRSPELQAALIGSAIGSGVYSGATLLIGVNLIRQGREDYVSAERESPAERTRALNNARRTHDSDEDEKDRLRKKLKGNDPDCTPGWDCPVVDGEGNSRDE